MAWGAALVLLTQPGLSWAEETDVTDDAVITAPIIKDANRFADLDQSYAKEAVERLASYKLVSGVTEELYEPDQQIKRQDFLLLLAKVIGMLPSGERQAPFADLSADSPYADYVNALIEAGIVKGRADGLLQGAEPLTRQEMAVLLARLIPVNGMIPASESTVQYADEAEIADFAREAVKVVTAKRWMNGSNGRFHPLEKVTRAEATVVADRILQERLKQAETLNFSVNAGKITLHPGESRRLEVKAIGTEQLPFTPIFTLDRPEIGEISPDGTFTAGASAGTGQITVSVGYKSIRLPVEVVAGGPSDSAMPDNTADKLINYAPDSFFSVKTTGTPDTYFHQLEQTYPGPVGGLVQPSDTWTGYLRQFGREITLTLPQETPVQKVRLSFQQDKKLGITLPAYMEVDLSKDGKAWLYAGKATHSVPASEETKLVRTLEVDVPSTDVRYVRVRFPVKVFVFARQLQVWGSEEQQDEVRYVMLPPAPQSVSWEDEKANDRIKNMVLAYSGGYGDLGTWKKEDFLPLVGYISPDGIIRDQMFDAVHFIPYPNLETTAEGWTNYLNDLFRPGRQLDALNEAMMEYNKRRGTLYIAPVKEKVILTLPYPNPKQTDFGKVREDQDSLSFSASDVGEERAFGYRKQALEWYFNQLKMRWDKAEFKYLQLDGIYWYNELIDDAVPRERELIIETANMVHQQGLRYYWIPYYGAPGLSEWKQLGFDYAFVQPNYYGNNPIPIDRIEATLEVANKYGMGIEIEGDDRMVRDLKYFQTYYNQLIAAHKLGIDKEKIHAYYYGSKSLLAAVNNPDPDSRAIYDDTYLWIKGRFAQQDYLLPQEVQTQAEEKPKEQQSTSQPASQTN